MLVGEHFQVEVLVDDQPADEYEDDEDDDTDIENAVTRYIQAVSGKRYQICVQIRPTYRFRGENALTVQVQVDGKHGGAVVLERHVFKPGVAKLGTVRGVYSGEGPNAKLYELRFGDLETREYHIP